MKTTNNETENVQRFEQTQQQVNGGLRFVWTIGDYCTPFPDMPETGTAQCPADGSVRLWDRKCGRAVMVVTAAYAQAICLERDHQGEAPFSAMEDWFNDLQDEDMAAEGVGA